MATAQEKATLSSSSSSSSYCFNDSSKSSSDRDLRDWTIVASDDSIRKPASSSMAALIRNPVDSLPPDPPTNTTSASTKGIPAMIRAQNCHRLDPLSAAEISVAGATVRAAGATPEVRDSMRFVEVVLVEPDKHVVALADAYFFPPFQPSLLPRTKGGPVIPSKLPPRQAWLVVYNKRSNETSIWVVEFSEVHAATKGGHHRGKVISSKVVPDVQPPMDAVEYTECEAVVKDYPPFCKAMKKRGIEDMDLVMVDPGALDIIVRLMLLAEGLLSHLSSVEPRATGLWKMVMPILSKESMSLLTCKTCSSLNLKIVNLFLCHLLIP